MGGAEGVDSQRRQRTVDQFPVSAFTRSLGKNAALNGNIAYERLEIWTPAYESFNKVYGESFASGSGLALLCRGRARILVWWRSHKGRSRNGPYYCRDGGCSSYGAVCGARCHSEDGRRPSRGRRWPDFVRRGSSKIAAPRRDSIGDRRLVPSGQSDNRKLTHTHQRLPLARAARGAILPLSYSFIRFPFLPAARQSLYKAGSKIESFC